MPKTQTQISNKSITMQKFELIAFKNSKLYLVKPSNTMSEWGSDKPRYKAAITAKNVQTRHAVGNFCISSGHCFSNFVLTNWRRLGSE